MSSGEEAIKDGVVIYPIKDILDKLSGYSSSNGERLVKLETLLDQITRQLEKLQETVSSQLAQHAASIQVIKQEITRLKEKDAAQDEQLKRMEQLFQEAAEARKELRAELEKAQREIRRWIGYWSGAVAASLLLIQIFFQYVLPAILGR